LNVRHVDIVDVRKLKNIKMVAWAWSWPFTSI